LALSGIGCRISWARIDWVGCGGLGGCVVGPCCVTESVIATVDVIERIFLASLANVVEEVRESPIARTIPRVLAAVPAPMVTVCVASARTFAANRVGVSDSVIVSDSVLVLAESLATVEDIVIVSVRLLTTF